MSRKDTEIFRIEHYSKGRGWVILSLDKVERSGVPFVFVTIEEYRKKVATIRLSPSEVVRLSRALLEALSGYPLVIGKKVSRRWKPRKKFVVDNDKSEEVEIGDEEPTEL